MDKMDDEHSEREEQPIRCKRLLACEGEGWKNVHLE